LRQWAGILFLGERGAWRWVAFRFIQQCRAKSGPWKWPVLPRDRINQLRHLAQYTASATTAYRDRLSMSAFGDLSLMEIAADENGVYWD
jgi:hypothetical protein